VPKSKNRKVGIQLALLAAVLAGSMFLLDSLSINTWIQILLLVVVLFYISICLFSFIVWATIVFRKRNYVRADGSDILIVAPHQDDGVAMAGGYAIQTLKKGGQVWVLFITDGYADDKVTRKQEAVEAWGTVGLYDDNLLFLKHHNFTGLLNKNEIDKCIAEIKQCIDQKKPAILIVPLYEGGNYQHDLTNFMVSQVIEKSALPGTVYEAPEYNFYFSLKTTPEKILSGLIRCVPFLKYHYAPEPILNDTVYYLKSDTDELEMKRSMLSKFKTQNPDGLVTRFGFEDRFQLFHDYDYSLPPFDYEHSLSKYLNILKTLPIIGKIVSKMVKWTRTIHPDKEYTISKIVL